MKLKKLYKRIEKYFEVDSSNKDEKKQEELMNSLNEKIDSTTEKIQNASSKSKKIKLKKKLDILKELKSKLKS